MSRAVRQLGYHSHEYDIRHGPDFDLTSKKVHARLRRDASRGRILGSVLAPVCTSFSTARNRTSVIRTKECSWGVTRQLSDRETTTLAEGNKIALGLLVVLRILAKYRVPFVVENPRSSLLWQLPELRRLFQQFGCHERVCDLCGFGARWRKRTLFVCHRLDESETRGLVRACTGKHSCSFSGQEHIRLSGNAPSGVAWTRVAQTYPQRLSTCLAKCILAEQRARDSYNLRWHHYL